MSLPSASRPNFLWISLEDTSPRFGCYGDPIARTPNIDGLAGEGTRYPNAFCLSGVCAPSRFAIITGMYPTAMGAHHMRANLTPNPAVEGTYDVVPPPYVKPFTEYLRIHGYYCTNNEKTDYQFATPVTAWDACHDRAHWRHRPAGQPFFCVFNPMFTHEGRMWPQDGERLSTDPDKVELPPYLPDTLECRKALARQYDNIARADEYVGQRLRELEEDGLADNTIVFLWSDHGEGLPRAKRWPYDAGIRIPFIVRSPGKQDAGRVSEQMISLIDLGPTLLSLAGIPLPRHLHGRPFMGSEAQERDHVFATRDRNGTAYDRVRAVRDRRFKYLRNYYVDQPYLPFIPYLNRHPVVQEMWRLHLDDKLEGPRRLMFQPRPPEELYELAHDPHEMNNLAEDPRHRETLVRMQGLLDAWQDAVGDLGDIPEAQMIKTWWSGDTQPKTAPPKCIPIHATSRADRPHPEGGAFSAPLLVQLHCGTEGASIAWTLDEGDDPHWALYTCPIRMPKRKSTLRAKAIRIGFLESDELNVEFTVT